jgi:FHS family glucose/mannose:H+ symporter-like MFS transporter
MASHENSAADIPPIATWRRLSPLFACTAAWGLVTVMLGPLLPALIARWNIQDAQAGTLFTASFLGQLVGAWFATRNPRLSLLSGAALSVVGTAMLAWVGFPLAHFALFATGIGISAGLTAGNVIAGLSTIHRARTLALFNVSWSIGAIACPALVRLSGPSNTRLFFLLTTAIVALGGILVATLPRTLTNPSSAPTQTTSPSSPMPVASILLFATCMLLYIGNENSLGGWLPSFAARNNSTISAPTIAMLYWLSELISRLAMATLLFRISEAALYRISLALLLTTQIVLIVLPHPSHSILLGTAILTGAAIGPVYPLIIAFLLSRSSNHPRLGRLFASASLGGATLPWLTGVISTHFGSLRAGLLVPTLGVALLLLLSPGILPADPASTSR